MAPLWDFSKAQFVGVLSASDFILILREVCMYGQALWFLVTLSNVGKIYYFHCHFSHKLCYLKILHCFEAANLYSAPRLHELVQKI